MNDLYIFFFKSNLRLPFDKFPRYKLQLNLGLLVAVVPTPYLKLTDMTKHKQQDLNL